MRGATILALLGTMMTLAACGHTTGTRAVTGGLLGAGAGAGVSALTGGRPATGAAIGGGAGAIGGAITREHKITIRYDTWRAGRRSAGWKRR